MPNALVKKYAKQSGKPVGTVEEYWKEAKKQASKRFKVDPGSEDSLSDKKKGIFYSYVNAIVRKRLELAQDDAIAGQFLESAKGIRPSRFINNENDLKALKIIKPKAKKD